MLKKSLHDQIKIIGFWTFGGVFWYLVIAFFLKSKYPIFDYSFNLENAYDVIKDALTLAASFLAPVAAFVLFTDWRDEHRAISNEKLSKQISDIISKISPLVGVSYINFDDSEKIVEFRQEYFSYLFEMGRNLIGINSIDKKSEKFIKDTQELNNLLVNIWLSLERQIVLNQELEKITSFDERSEALKRSYTDQINEISIKKSSFIEDFLKKKAEINILYV
ncbi:hypothetical protein [Acinetobacter baumannii]|uniref:DUF4760 domain-containing protein n=1 Tax=Acinetobacter baumannii TaxID=470 RepID=A0A7S8WBM6_ACIBA|nr:hypothetical protein [Acinetobacter baumannii]QPF12104.1 hypothetical protein IMO23_10715 [Acinetobacter baumannii]